ncbi:hypothetical protein WN943_024702 [Citrus x changshan-huyou]
MAFVERFRDTRVAACYLRGVGLEKIVLRGVGDVRKTANEVLREENECLAGEKINQLEKNGDVVAQARAITTV